MTNTVAGNSPAKEEKGLVRIARIRTHGAQGYLARVEGDLAVPLIEDVQDPGRDVLREALGAGFDLGSAPACAETVPLGSCRLLAPVAAPEKIIAIGLNYADHARESGLEPPSAPVAFVKTTNSIIGHGESIRYEKRSSEQVDYEVELAVLIGRRAKSVAEGAALDHVLGYTVCNDVSARDAQFADGQWVRGKSFDTFCPLGPWIVSTDEIPDPQDLGLRCRVNGEVLQEGTTSDMIFGVAEIISYLSQFMTLEPGDVIATGTPYGVGFARTPPVFLLDGDVVEVEVDGIGVLRNPVVVEAATRGT